MWFKSVTSDRRPRVEGGEGGEEGHGGAPVRQHVQHGAKLAALAEHPRGVAVQSVQQAGDDVTPGGHRVVGRHEPEAQQGQQDPHVADQVGNEQKDVLRFPAERFLQL